MLNILKALIYLKISLIFILKWGLGKPLYWLWKEIANDVLSPIYKIYFPIKKKLTNVFASKNKILYPFSNRYVIHVAIILIAVLVIVNNTQAKEIRSEEMGKTSLLASLVKGNEEEEIVETADSIYSTNTRYINTTGRLAASVTTGSDKRDDTSLATAEGGTVVLKPNIPTTSKIGAPGDEVIYHIVQGGETVSTIAERYSVSTKTILWENRLSGDDFIKPDQKLTILPASGVSHRIKEGDTIDKLVNKYGGDKEEIIEFNQLASADAIKANDVLIVPGGKMPAPPAPQPTTPKTITSIFSPDPPAGTTPTYGATFHWPTTSRKINQYYHWRHHGIDIDGTYSSPIYSADSGQVEATGWNGGYGNRVVINHGGGRKTLYAHLSKIYVKPGQSVGRGETIGMMGCNGWCTGTHLHFETIINGQKVNPLSVTK